MIKIAHISDLHFCVPALYERIQRFSSEVADKLHIDLEISRSSKEIADALTTFIGESDPDLIILSGDVTTFGDRESFDAAYDWLRPLLVRSEGRAARSCIVVPGNHDVLEGQLSYLLNQSFARLPWYARFGLKHLAQYASSRS